MACRINKKAFGADFSGSPAKINMPAAVTRGSCASLFAISKKNKSRREKRGVQGQADQQARPTGTRRISEGQRNAQGNHQTQQETGIALNPDALEPDFAWSLSYQVTYKKRASTIVDAISGKEDPRPAGKTFLKTVHYFLAWVPEPVQIQCTEHLGYEWREWQPPFAIQRATIDPLLQAVGKHLSGAANDSCHDNE
ncbi:MAG: hypothetical protein AAFP69_17920 [Planctomycetota bacterium]